MSDYKKSYGPLDNAILRHHFTAQANANELYQTPPMEGAGSYSTLRTAMVQHPSLNGGKPTVIPTIWKGRMISTDQAIRLAVQSGQQWPTADPNQPWEQSPDAAWHQYIYQMGSRPAAQNAFVSDKYRYQ